MSHSNQVLSGIYFVFTYFHVFETVRIYSSNFFLCSKLNSGDERLTFPHKVSFTFNPKSIFSHPAHVRQRVLFHFIKTAVPCNFLHLIQWSQNKLINVSEKTEKGKQKYCESSLEFLIYSCFVLNKKVLSPVIIQQSWIIWGNIWGV